MPRVFPWCRLAATCAALVSLPGWPGVAAGQTSAPTPSQAGVLPTTPQLPAFQVVRSGRFRSVGKNVPFPRRAQPGVVFSQSILEGKAREDGYLDLARSRDGRQLWTRRAADDGDEHRSTFRLQSEAPLPPGAVLQMVDGFVTPDPGGRPGGLGSPAFRRGEQIWRHHFEAWLALPAQRLIVRPADGSRYPLVCAAGMYDEAEAARAQWVVFVSRCPETRSACVYYGPPAASCARSARAGESDGLLVYPDKCPAPP